MYESSHKRKVFLLKLLNKETVIQKLNNKTVKGRSVNICNEKRCRKC